MFVTGRCPRSIVAVVPADLPAHVPVSLTGARESYRHREALKSSLPVASLTGTDRQKLDDAHRQPTRIEGAGDVAQVLPAPTSYRDRPRVRTGSPPRPRIEGTGHAPTWGVAGVWRLTGTRDAPGGDSSPDSGWRR